MNRSIRVFESTVVLLISLMLFKTSVYAMAPEEGIAGNESPSTPEYVPGRVIVQLKEGASIAELDQLNLALGISGTRELYPARQDPKNVLKELKQRREGLEGKEHHRWYWWAEEGKEAEDYQARLEAEKKQMDGQIQAMEERVGRLERRQARAPEGVAIPRLEGTYVFQGPEQANVPAMVAAYSTHPAVEYASPDAIARIQLFPETLPNDAYVDPKQNGTWSKGAWGQAFEDMWGLKRIQADKAWPVSQGEGMLVAVVDTGVDRNHEDLAANMWVNAAEIPGNRKDDDGNGYVDDVYGYDFANRDGDPMDDHGHGTHVAGTIAAVGNNGIGVIGVAPKAKIIAVKGLSKDGWGAFSDLAASVRYAVDQGADITSNSWGYYMVTDEPEFVAGTRLIVKAFEYAYSQGAMSVAAAGNAAVRVEYVGPASYSNVIRVGALEPQNTIAPWSNFGYFMPMDLCAPGVGILSLRAVGTDMYAALGRASRKVGEKYYWANGTSMACPHVSGVVALVLSRHPDWTFSQVREALHNAAIKLGDKGYDPFSGYGIVDAKRAVESVEPAEVSISSPRNGQSLVLDAGRIEILGRLAPPNLSAWKQPAFGALIEAESSSRLMDWRLAYGVGSAPKTWVTIASGQADMTSKKLGDWDVRSLPEGIYTLRLVAREHRVTNVIFRWYTDLDHWNLDRWIPRRITHLYDQEQEDRVVVQLESEVWAQPLAAGPWQNRTLPEDVNGDGRVTPMDVLKLVNEINSGRWPPYHQPLPILSSELRPPPYVDVDGDNYLTPSDARYVMNYLSTPGPWQNRARPEDVNGDGQVTPQDVLNLVNAMNSGRWPAADQPLPPPTPGQKPPPYVDVTGNNRLTPSDARRVANYLRRLANRQPVISPIGDKRVEEGATLSFTVSAVDPDGDPISYWTASLPRGASFSGSTRTFTWTPDYTQAGVYDQFHFFVGDGTRVSRERITITVADKPGA